MSENIIVTHQFPDIDALMSVWLVKRFGGKRWETASVELVPHGETYRGLDPDAYEQIVHVDTGGGHLDHHDSQDRTCAAKKTLTWLGLEDDILERMVEYAVSVDHFEDVDWHEPLADVWNFGLEEILAGVKLSGAKENDNGVVEWALVAFDGVYASFKDKVKAINQIQEFGLEVQTSFGRALAIYSFNDEILRVALKQGYVLVLRQDPQKKYVRVKAHPSFEVDLTHLYQKLQALDPQATWILHTDKKQLMNGSSADEKRVITELDWDVLVEELGRL